VLSQPPIYEYQVGGSLKLSCHSYVTRDADEALFQALWAGEVCYVFSARQMGKSSLHLRVSQRLKSLNVRTVTLDMTRIGGEQVTLEQWYRGVILSLLGELGLVEKVQLKQQWQAWQALPMLQRLGLLLDEILQVHLPDQHLVIFIDEVDSALSLAFPVDDFFAFIRSCYNYRTQNPHYERLTWALFGVTTPGQLIRDPSRTPFNLGYGIKLQGFEVEDIAPLVQGVAEIIPEAQSAVEQILIWTGGQPLLTQKLCRLLVETELAWQQKMLESSAQNLPSVAFEPSFSPASKCFSMADRIERLVRSRLVQNWQTQDQPEHFRTIRDRILRQEQLAGRLLSMYQSILQQGYILIDNSPEQDELMLSGLVVQVEQQLRVHNRIYQLIFDGAWVEQQLANLRPYGVALTDWLRSQRQDESKLLRGNSLAAAQDWIQGKRLSDDDYQFIAASQAYDQVAMQQQFEAARLQEVEARLAQEQRNTRLQRVLLILAALTMVLLALFGSVAYFNYHRAVASELRARVSELNTLAASAQAQAAAHNHWNALLEAMRANIRAQDLPQDLITPTKLAQTLQQTFLAVREVNSLPHTSTLYSVRYSPDGQLIAAGGADGTLKLWRQDGQVVATIPAHQGAIHVLRFSPDGQMLATGSEDASVKLWGRDGRLIRTINGFQGGVWRLEFSEQAPQIGTLSMDRFARIWTTDGQLLKTIGGKGEDKAEGLVAISPDLSMAAIGSRNHTIQLWRRRNGLPFSRLKGHQAAVWGLAFSQDCQLLASGSDDGVVKLWTRHGKLLHTLGKLDGTARSFAFSQDNQLLAAAGSGDRIWIWRTNGELIEQLEMGKTFVWDLAFSPDGSTLASVGDDQQVHLWKLQHPWVQTLRDHHGVIQNLDIAADGQRILSTSNSGVIKLWNRQGQLLETFEDPQRFFLRGALAPEGQGLVTSTLAGALEFRDGQGHVKKRIKAGSGGVQALAFSPDGQHLATGDQNRTLSLWSGKGAHIHSLIAHDAGVNHVTFSPNGQRLVSSSTDQTARLWDLKGQLLATLRGHSGPVLAAQFTPDGQTILTASGDQTLRWWNLEGELLRTVKAHDTEVGAIAIRPDGGIIASGGVDSTIKLWNEQGQWLTTLSGHSASIKDLRFTPDGQTLVSGSVDKTIKLWSVEQILHQDPLRASCTWMKDYLPPQEHAPQEYTDSTLQADIDLQQACQARID
jgi:WD40 repeat protein